MNNNYINVDYHKCVGCGTCEMVCSLSHENICSPELSRIRVFREEKEGAHLPITCAGCEEAPCIKSCPVSAIFRSEISGAILITVEKCIGCRSCVRACPFGHANYNPYSKKAFKCDLCEGEPKCVEYCWTGALTYGTVDEALTEKRKKIAEKTIDTNTYTK